MNPTFEIIPITIEARGEVITNNLPEVREMVREWLANVNRDLSTDEDFGQAELDTKALKELETRFQSAKEKALAEAIAIHELFQTIDDTVEEIRAPRLELEKLIAKRKEEVKSEIIEEALAAFDVDPKDARKRFLPGLQSAIKGKRTLDSMRQACRIYATTAQAKIGQCRALLTRFEDTHGAEMTLDRRELELGEPDALEAELRRRFEARKAIREKMRLEEEAAKAKAEADALKAPASNVVHIKGVLPPDNLPKPPKVGALPTGPSPAAEWEAWISACKTTFGALKAARERLRHDMNRRCAEVLTSPVNDGYQAMIAAWKAMQEAGSEVAQ